jgi:uncharacterized membrane protein YfcA
LLIITPGRLLGLLIPLLLGLATLMFSFGAQITSRLLAHTPKGASASGKPQSIHLPILFAISVYGGYFGAGLGIVLLAAFSMTGGSQYRFANAMKNFVGILTNIVAAIVFVLQEVVDWPAAGLMMIGSVAGGWLGVVMSRIVPYAMVRMTVIALGAAVTASSAWHYWR